LKTSISLVLLLIYLTNFSVEHRDDQGRRVAFPSRRPLATMPSHSQRHSDTAVVGGITMSGTSGRLRRHHYQFHHTSKNREDSAPDDAAADRTDEGRNVDIAS
jgi:hypothetical protein